MKLEKLFIGVAILATITAIPVASTLKSRTTQLKIERSDKARLQLRIDSVQKQLDQKEQQIKKDQQDKTDLQNKNSDLQTKLQSKRQTQQTLAVAVKVQQAGTYNPPVAVSGGCETLRPLVAQYGWPVSTAMAVMQAESGCNPSSNNPTDYHIICLGSRGLFQIGCDSTPNFGGMFDANANVAQAYSMWARRGWQPWGAYTSGKYLQYLR